MMYCFQHGVCQHQHEGHGGKSQLFAETPEEENPHAMASFGDVEWRLQGAPPPPQALYGEAHSVPWLVCHASSTMSCVDAVLMLFLSGCLTSSRLRLGARSFGFRGLWSNASSDASTSTGLHRAQLSRQIKLLLMEVFTEQSRKAGCFIAAKYAACISCSLILISGEESS